MMYGYAGHILRIDLTHDTITKEPMREEVVRDYLGARGLGAYLLWTEVPKGADPLGSDNKLFISPGPLSGVLFPGAGKMDFTTKSPLTGLRRGQHGRHVDRRDQVCRLRFHHPRRDQSQTGVPVY